jgi:hypothetical protein
VHGQARDQVAHGVGFSQRIGVRQARIQNTAAGGWLARGPVGRRFPAPRCPGPGAVPGAGTGKSPKTRTGLALWALGPPASPFFFVHVEVPQLHFFQSSERA